jgi:hypothetical protein
VSVPVCSTELLL